MVLISSQVYWGPVLAEQNRATLGELPTEHCLTHIDFLQNATGPSDREIMPHYSKLSLEQETLKLCIIYLFIFFFN